MLRSSTQLAKSHRDDLGLEYLWNGDEYSSLENCFKAIQTNSEYRGQQEVLALVHVIERPITVHFETQTRHCFWRSSTDCSSIDILYYPEERDDKGELIKAGNYVLLRRATLLSQPENEEVYSLGDYVAVCSETTDWFMYVMSDINDPSKEMKVRFMKESGQYILLSKKFEKWFPKSAIFHRCSLPYHTIPSTDDPMRYSFDTIDI